MEQNSFSNTPNNSTEGKKKEEKTSKLSIDSDYDFIFLKNWPSIVRWLLVIPAGILTLIMTQLSFGYIVNIIDKSVDSFYVSLIISGIFMIFKLMIFEITIVAVAPVKKEKKFITGVFLAIIPLSILALVVFVLKKANGMEEIETYYPTTSLVVGIVTGFLGIVWALYSIKTETDKKPEEPMQEVQ